MKKLTILFLLLLSFYTSAFAELTPLQLRYKAYTDSVAAELPNLKADTNKVDLYFSLATAMSNIDFEKALKYAGESLELANDLDWEKGKANSYYLYATIYFATRSHTDEAMDNFNKAVEIYKKIGYQKMVARCFNDIGSLLQLKANLPLALERYYQALKIQEEMGDSVRIGKIFNNIAMVYSRKADYDKALEYYHKSLEIQMKLDRFGAISPMGNIALIHKKRKEYQKAIEVLNKALVLSKESGRKSLEANIVGQIAAIYLLQEDFEKSIEYFYKAVGLFETGRTKQFLGGIYNNIGDAYLMLAVDSVLVKIKKESKYISFDKKVNLKKSIEFFNKALTASKVTGNVETQSYIMAGLSQAYEQKKDFQKSLEYFKGYKEIQDSLFNSDKSREIGRLEAGRTQLEKEYAEKEVARIAAEEQEHRNILQYSGIAIGTLLAFLLLFVLSKKNISFGVIDTMTFLAFLLVYEFVLVVSEPWVDSITNQVPIYKLGINITFALIFIPLHILEAKFKKRVREKKGNDY